MKLDYPYRNDNNQRYSRQLFYEQWVQLPIELRSVEPPFTLFDRNKEGYKCFGQMYVEDEDPTGYTTATRIFGDYSYWTYLMRSGWFREAVDIWNTELDARLKSKGIKKIKQIAESEDKGALQAAKYLADHGYKNAKTVSTRGRPSKEEVAGRLAEEAREAKETLADAERIKLVKQG